MAHAGTLPRPVRAGAARATSGVAELLEVALLATVVTHVVLLAHALKVTCLPTVFTLVKLAASFPGVELAFTVVAPGSTALVGPMTFFLAAITPTSPAVAGPVGVVSTNVAPGTVLRTVIIIVLGVLWFSSSRGRSFCFRFSLDAGLLFGGLALGFLLGDTAFTLNLLFWLLPVVLTLLAHHLNLFCLIERVKISKIQKLGEKFSFFA